MAQYRTNYHRSTAVIYLLVLHTAWFKGWEVCLKFNLTLKDWFTMLTGTTAALMGYDPVSNHFASTLRYLAHAGHGNMLLFFQNILWPRNGVASNLIHPPLCPKNGSGIHCMSSTPLSSSSCHMWVPLIRTGFSPSWVILTLLSDFNHIFMYTEL